MPYPKFTRPSSLVDQIYKSLEKAILSNEIKGGESLNESELQKNFGVSRAPIREAIRLLQSDGLVVVDNYRRKRVRKLVPKDVRNSLPVLEALETLAAKLAVAHMTEETIATLENNVYKLEEAYKEKNFDLCSQLNREFHKTYIEAAGNDILAQTISSVMKRSISYYLSVIYFEHQDLVPSFIEEHKEIIEAFRSKDVDKAVQKTVKHFSNTSKLWNDSLQHEDAVPCETSTEQGTGSA